MVGRGSEIRARALPLLLSTILLLTGCGLNRKPPPALAAPAARVELRQYAGTALSGPGATPIEASAFAAAWGVSARVVAVQKLPEDPSFAPLGPQARLVINSEPTALFAPSTRLVYTSRIRPLDGSE